MAQTQRDTIVVFTARSPDRIIRESGSQAWVLNATRAKSCTWLVCTQNRHHPDHNFSDATEPHGCGFLLGKISGVQPSPEDPSRWLITISEFVRINYPDLWDHSRNPTRYASLKELGIKLDGIEFEPMPTNSPHALESRPPGQAPTTLTIAEAKKALAATFGVSSDAVEITIRG